MFFQNFRRPSAGFFFRKRTIPHEIKKILIKWQSTHANTDGNDCPIFDDHSPALRIVLIQFHIRIVEINLITVIKSHNVFGIIVGRLQVFPPLLLRRIVFLPRFPFVLRITFLEHSALVVSTGRSNLPVWAWKTENFYK